MQSRNFLTTCVALGLILLASSDASAQQARRYPNQATTAKTQTAKTQAVNNKAAKSEVEQEARMRWQPSRPQSATAAEDSQVRQVAHQQATRGAVRRTQGTDTLPAPIQPKPLPHSEMGGTMSEVPLMDIGGEGYEVPMQSDRSVLQHAPQSNRSTHVHQPMDGEVVYDSEPYMGNTNEVEYGDSLGCDSMGCSCGRMGCDGGCNSCDSGSCGSCNSCRGNAWRPCLTLCFPQDGWVSFDYLNWNQKGLALPPLVTTGGTTQATAGVLGLNTTSVLFGGNSVLSHNFSGGRLNFGFWLDQCHLWGVGADYLDLGKRSTTFSRSSAGTAGSTVLARPFFNSNTGLEDSELVAFPSVLSGTVAANVTSDLVGGGFHLLRQTNCSSSTGRSWFCGGCSTVQNRTYALVGYRYLQLDESVGISENLTSLQTAPNNGTFQINDSFRTRNQFNGLDLGFLHNRRRGNWALDSRIKMALGDTHQTVDINGTTSTNGAAAQTGGLLAQSTNIGHHERDRFSVLPELGVNLGYYLTPNFKVRVGYTLIYWSNVVRPGDQIDTQVNPSLLPPEQVPFTGSRTHPGFHFVQNDYYVQGVNVGAELNW